MTKPPSEPGPPHRPASARPLADDTSPRSLPRARVVTSDPGPSGESRAFLLALGFLVLGPLVIPRIRSSSAFGPRERVIWPLALAAYSMLMVLTLIVATWLIMSWQLTRQRTSSSKPNRTTVELHHGG